MDTKALIFSKSFWSILGMAITGVDWVSLIEALNKLVQGQTNDVWDPVVQAAAMLLLAVLGAFGVLKRKTTIDGIIFSSGEKS